MSFTKMKLTTLFTTLIVVAFIGLMIYILIPMLTTATYQGEIRFNTTRKVKFQEHDYLVGGSTIGSFQLTPGNIVLVEEKSSPCGSSCLHFNHALLINQETGEIVDATKFLIMDPSTLQPPSNGTYTIGIGVRQTVLYDQEKSVGTWTLKITIKKAFPLPS